MIKESEGGKWEKKFPASPSTPTFVVSWYQVLFFPSFSHDDHVMIIMMREKHEKNESSTEKNGQTMSVKTRETRNVRMMSNEQRMWERFNKKMGKDIMNFFSHSL